MPTALEIFTAARPRLFGIAYRMLGTVADAEDILQDVWIKWQAVDQSTVTDAAALLATMTTRLAINVATSARAQRETYVGPWIPEPVDTGADPTLGAERGEALELAVLMLLERLTPTERAAYVLREAFDYPYPQIAEIVQLSEVNVRKVVSRARANIAAERRASVGSLEQRRLLAAFLVAAQAGDLAALEALFAADVVSYSDGGGAVRASKFPVLGQVVVAKYVAAFASHFWTGAEIEWFDANGAPAIIALRDGAPFAVVSIAASGNGIDQLMWVMNPDKLSSVTDRHAALS